MNVQQFVMNSLLTFAEVPWHYNENERWPLLLFCLFKWRLVFSNIVFWSFHFYFRCAEYSNPLDALLPTEESDETKYSH